MYLLMIGCKISPKRLQKSFFPMCRQKRSRLSFVTYYYLHCGKSTGGKTKQTGAVRRRFNRKVFAINFSQQFRTNPMVANANQTQSTTSLKSNEPTHSVCNWTKKCSMFSNSWPSFFQLCLLVCFVSCLSFRCIVERIAELFQ